MAVDEKTAENAGKSEIPSVLTIEGREVPWDQPTITPEQVAKLGGWDPSQGVILVDKDNTERTLSSGDVIKLEPGMGFGKRIKWKRGNDA